ncbi:hypothetical protein CEQ90_16325 [Lewinellaceae bacterium SD302]|nr:hypothetical protein CEQ90_16325 [Lewinellaceae bacterium SD302]
MLCRANKELLLKIKSLLWISESGQNRAIFGSDNRRKWDAIGITDYFRGEVWARKSSILDDE